MPVVSTIQPLWQPFSFGRHFTKFLIAVFRYIYIPVTSILHGDRFRIFSIILSGAVIIKFLISPPRIISLEAHFKRISS